MAKSIRGKSASSYRSVGSTYDGVRVLAPKTKSKTFTAAEVRKIIDTALREHDAKGRSAPLTTTGVLRVEKRAYGKFKVKRPGAKRASAVMETQGEAVAKAREVDPGKAPIVKRVRKSPAGKRGTWRKS